MIIGLTNLLNEFGFRIVSMTELNGVTYFYSRKAKICRSCISKLLNSWKTRIPLLRSMTTQFVNGT